MPQFVLYLDKNLFSTSNGFEGGEAVDTDDKTVMHEFESEKTLPLAMNKLILVLLITAALGVGTGYLLTQGGKGKSSVATTSQGTSSTEKGAVIGSDDTKTFKDVAEGELKEGGIEGEGQYHLVRPGGESQYVYLTSSIVDLSAFIDTKIKVWGQTQKAQTAGWLMDVGRVEVLE
jgi:hypothetical protein